MRFRLAFDFSNFAGFRTFGRQLQDCHEKSTRNEKDVILCVQTKSGRTKYEQTKSGQRIYNAYFIQRRPNWV